MASRPGGAVLGHLRRLLDQGTVAGLSEGQLLDRFAARGDEAAFAAIVARHGPMVLAVCRRVLGDSADADDAFQATFLVLVRRARSIRRRESLAAWLHGVAHRVASRARLDAARRRRHERARGGAMPTATGPEMLADDFGPILHEELARLPEKYRAPLVLCYLEGHTHDQAADALGWPVGTVRGRLARARDQLRGRLARRGVGLTGAVLVAALSAETTAAVPEFLIESTTRAAVLAAAGRLAVAGAVSAGAIRLWEDTLRSLLMSKLKGLAAVALLVAGLVVTGGGLRAYQAGKGSPKADEAKASPPLAVDERGTPIAPPDQAKGDRSNDEEDQPGAATARRDDELEGIPPKNAPKTPEEQYRQYAKQAEAARKAANGDAGLSLGGPTPRGDTPADRRLGAAIELLRAQEAFYEQGTVTINHFIEASRRVLDSQQDLCEKPADRVAAARAHRDRMAGVLAAEKRRFEAGTGSRPNVAEAVYALAEADVLLAKAEPSKGKDGAAVADGAGGDEKPLEYQGDKDPKSRAILALLDEPIAMSVQDTPLKDVLKYIRSKSESKTNPHGINIYVDPSAVDNNNHPINLDTSVTIDLEGVPLRRSLQLVLLPLGLSYGVVDGILVISNPTKITNLQMHDPYVAPSPAELKQLQQMRNGRFFGGGMR